MDEIKASSDEEFVFSEANEKEFVETLGRYPTKMAALLPALWIAQNQNGYITLPIMEYIAERLDLSPVHVYSVCEFYAMYHKSPPGRYHLQLCRTLSCVLCKMEDIQGHLESRYGIHPGKKTENGMFSLALVECLGSCGTAPVMRVNDVYCENLTIEKVDRIIEACKRGETLEEDPMLAH